jgi:hypothetical protein
MKKGILVSIVVALVLAVAGSALAQEASQEKAGTKPLRKEVVFLKYLKARDVRNFVVTFLRPGYGIVTPGPTEGSLVISDYPENVEQALQALKKIDVKPADLQFTVQLILGSETGQPGRESLSNDPIIRELKSLLKYKAYSLLDSTLVRAMDGADSEVRMGDKADYRFWIRPKVMKDEKSSLIQMEVRLTEVRIAGTPPNATSSKVEYITTDLIGTTLNLKPGDKTVVGVSKLDGGDKGLILIISGKIVD